MGLDNTSIFDAFCSPRLEHAYTNSPPPGSPLPHFQSFDLVPSDPFVPFYNNQATEEATLTNLFRRPDDCDISVDVSRSNKSKDRSVFPKSSLLQNDDKFTKSSKSGPKKGIGKILASTSSDSSDGGESDMETKGGSSKQNKGLKLLSVVVKDIVMTRKYTTYKDVANIILHDGNEPDNGMQTVSREEQNIKRRVYDALNVLISAGVLVKDGKKVKKNESSKLIQLNKLQSTIVV
jgi:hypothetical protein